MVQTRKRVGRVSIMAGAIMLLSAVAARAVPSFVRQTGLPCNTCHTPFPQLTAFGREFKLGGYTFANTKQIKIAGTDKDAAMQLLEVFPLAAMVQTAFTRTNATQPGTQNNDVQFPQQLSLFLAGQVAPHVGTFLQATYTDQDNTFSLDNTDIRYANQTTVGGKDFRFGFTLNNNPTVEDLWHSTPAWGFPWATADEAPTPAAGALIDGALAQQVVGLGGYALWNDHLYANVAVYRSENLGGPQPPTGIAGDTIKDVAPYWRLAWQQQWGVNYLEVGTLGLFAQLFPGAVSGAHNTFTDLAFDFQYERPFGNDGLAVHGIYMYEHQNLDAAFTAGNAANTSNHLHTFRIDGSYRIGNRVKLSLQYFRLWGDTDPGLYAPAPVSGSANGNPDSSGMITQIAYYPWQNIRLSAQYTSYFKFNGARTNYDGAGRDASDNNTLYILAWLLW